MGKRRQVKPLIEIPAETVRAMAGRLESVNTFEALMRLYLQAEGDGDQAGMYYLELNGKEVLRFVSLSALRDPSVELDAKCAFELWTKFTDWRLSRREREIRLQAQREKRLAARAQTLRTRDTLS
jgi:hypothetical protein